MQNSRKTTNLWPRRNRHGFDEPTGAFCAEISESAGYFEKSKGRLWPKLPTSPKSPICQGEKKDVTCRGGKGWLKIEEREER